MRGRQQKELRLKQEPEGALPGGRGLEEGRLETWAEAKRPKERDRPRGQAPTPQAPSRCLYSLGQESFLRNSVRDFPGGSVVGIHLPTQGTPARSLVWEDATRHSYRRLHAPDLCPATRGPSLHSRCPAQPPQMTDRLKTAGLPVRAALTSHPEAAPSGL